MPHIVKMQQWSSDLVPPLASVLVHLNKVHFDKPETEAAFHDWLQKQFPLPQLQTVYSSVMYNGWLKKRLAAQLKNAQEDKTARATLLPLLQESSSSNEWAAEIKIVATLDDTTVNIKEKVELLWSTPNASQIISKWSGLSETWSKYMPFAKNAQWPNASGLQVVDVYAVMGELEDAGIADVPNVALKSFFAECLKVRKTGNAFLMRVMQEQIVARMGATATAETSDPSEDMDFSDCKDVAKELLKSWIAAVKTVAKYPHLEALQKACARTPRRNHSNAENPKGAPAAPAAAGAAHTAEIKKEKTTDEADAAKDDVEGAPAAPAAAGESEAKPIDEEVGPPKDQSGKNTLEVGAIVVMTAKKQKHLYNGFKAKILRVNTHNVVVSILEGPASGEKRKLLFAAVDVIEDSSAKKAKIEQETAAAAAAAEAPAAAPSAEAPAAAPAAEAPAEDDDPDNACMAMFGDLDMYT